MGKKTEDKRGPGGLFVPGCKPGPGRPKGITLSEEFKRECRTAAWDALPRIVELLDHKDPDVRLKAWCALLDRGMGKPTMALEVSGPEGEPVRLNMTALTTEQLEQLDAIRQTLKGEGGDEPKTPA